MEPISTSVIAAILSALLAMISKIVVNAVSKNSKRELVVKDESGREKLFEFEAGLPTSEMHEVIKNELELERSVKSVLDVYLQSIGRSTARVGQFVDFIADFGSEKIAIEVKDSLRDFNSQVFEKYMSEEENLSKLIMFTMEPVRPRIREKASLLEREGRLHFVVFNKNQNIEEQIERISDAVSSLKVAYKARQGDTH